MMRPGLTYANVVASLSLFLVLAGTSYAAVKIDGSDVKDGSLTGRDIKNRSIAPRDLSKKALGQRGQVGPRGPRGVVGPRGLAGPPGARGERGPSLGNFVRGFPGAVTAGSPVSVGRLELGGGSWILMAAGTLENQPTSRSTVECSLRVGSDESDSEFLTGTGELELAGAGTGPAGTTESFSMLSAIPLPEAGFVELTCRSDEGPVRIRRSAVTAIRVADLVDQTDESGFPI